MKQLYCKPGDIAVLVKADLPVNVGQLVLVLCAHAAEPRLFVKGRGHIWLVKTVSGRNTLNYFRRNELIAQLA